MSGRILTFSPVEETVGSEAPIYRIPPAGGIPDDLDGESAKQKLFQVRDSLKGILEYLE